MNTGLNSLQAYLLAALRAKYEQASNVGRLFLVAQAAQVLGGDVDAVIVQHQDAGYPCPLIRALARALAHV